VKYLFEDWGKIEKILNNANFIYFFSDYDGTLTPIAKRPELAKLDEQTKELLISITNKPKHKLIIVSGRSIRNLISTVRIKGIYYSGNHGFEIKGPDMDYSYPLSPNIKDTVLNIFEILRSQIGKIEGVILEHKGATLSIHYRLTPNDKVNTIKNAVKRSIKIHEDLKITSGKKVMEIRPKVDWDKGRTVLWIMSRFKEKGLVIYLGDDTTDEDAFSVIKNGITILVSNRRRSSKAKYYVNNVKEVKKFLKSVHEV
jgi:trehalose 6-phosphate phosphatase